MFRSVGLVAIVTAIALTTVVDSVTAQGLTRRFQLRYFDGEIKSVRGSRLVWESDGRTEQIPVNRSTKLTVTGRGDAGFVTPNCYVTVSGTLRPDKSIIGAEMQVHLNPKQTASTPQRAYVEESDPQIRITGRLVNSNPLTLKATDTIEFLPAVRDTNASTVASPPVFGAVLTFKLREPNPENVSLIIGSSPNLISPGDTARVAVSEENPKVAYSVTVRKAEPLSSGRKKADTEEGEKKAGDDDGKPE